MKPRLHLACGLLIAVALAAGSRPFAQEPDPEIAKQPARPSPIWIKSGVIYQIFVRAFSPAGDLNGVTARLDELHALNVNILWLMPIHPDGQVKKKGSLGSPYAVRDYYAIDPALGTKDDLHRLVQEAHKRQMKVIIDIVANHTAWDSVMMAHPDFYKKDAAGSHHLSARLDRCRVARLFESQTAPVHARHARLLDQGFRPRRIPLRCRVRGADRLLGAGARGPRKSQAGHHAPGRSQQARSAEERLRHRLFLAAHAYLERRHHERRTGDRNSHEPSNSSRRSSPSARCTCASATITTSCERPRDTAIPERSPPRR